MTISNNYLIGTLDGSNSILIYGYFSNGIIADNFGNRSDYFVMTGTSIDITYQYNVIIKGQIRDANGHVFNNVFYAPNRCLTSGHGTEEFYNNVVYFTQEGQQAYQQGSVGVADYNLYNQEQLGMFAAVIIHWSLQGRKLIR